MKAFAREHILPLILIVIGCAVAAFSIECFLVPCTILDGGVVGISMMINYLSDFSLSLLLMILNVPFFILGFKRLGKRFLFRGVFAMAVFALSIELFASVGSITQSELLAVVFGGVLLGTGLGMILRYGGCLDGTEIVAMILSRRLSASTGQIIFAFNIVIYGVAGILFGWDRAMYSLLTYFITFKIIDFVEQGMEQGKAAMIITEHADVLADMIYKRLGRTCTFISAEGLVSGSGKTGLYCVFTRVELSELKRIVRESDVSAFVTISEVSEILGNHIKNTQKLDEKVNAE